MTVGALFYTFSTQMCGKRTFTRATGESEYPQQYSKLNSFRNFSLLQVVEEVFRLWVLVQVMKYLPIQIPV